MRKREEEEDEEAEDVDEIEETQRNVESQVGQSDEIICPAGE